MNNTNKFCSTMTMTMNMIKAEIYAECHETVLSAHSMSECECVCVRVYV